MKKKNTEKTKEKDKDKNKDKDKDKDKGKSKDKAQDKNNDKDNDKVKDKNSNKEKSKNKKSAKTPDKELKSKDKDKNKDKEKDKKKDKNKDKDKESKKKNKKVEEGEDDSKTSKSKSKSKLKQNKQGPIKVTKISVKSKEKQSSSPSKDDENKDESSSEKSKKLKQKEKLEDITGKSSDIIQEIYSNSSNCNNNKTKYRLEQKNYPVINPFRKHSIPEEYDEDNEGNGYREINNKNKIQVRGNKQSIDKEISSIKEIIDSLEFKNSSLQEENNILYKLIQNRQKRRRKNKNYFNNSQPSLPIIKNLGFDRKKYSPNKKSNYLREDNTVDFNQNGFNDFSDKGNISNQDYQSNNFNNQSYNNNNYNGQSINEINNNNFQNNINDELEDHYAQARIDYIRKRSEDLKQQNSELRSTQSALRRINENLKNCLKKNDDYKNDGFYSFRENNSLHNHMHLTPNSQNLNSKNIDNFDKVFYKKIPSYPPSTTRQIRTSNQYDYLLKMNNMKLKEENERLKEKIFKNTEKIINENQNNFNSNAPNIINLDLNRSNNRLYRSNNSIQDMREKYSNGSNEMRNRNEFIRSNSNSAFGTNQGYNLPNMSYVNNAPMRTPFQFPMYGNNNNLMRERFDMY